MGVLPGPFKIVLQGLERQSSSDTLGDPTAARVRVEVGRLFQLDDETASNIVSAVPIVIVDGLDARAAGVVRDRMQVLRDAGCRVVITDEVTDTIPRVNWPQLPPIARVDASNEDRRGGGGHAEGLSCPHCGGGLQVVAAGAGSRGGSPMNGREPQREPEPAPVYDTSAPPTPAPREREREAARSARAADDDWLSPPVGASAPPAPPPSTARRPSGRFDDAALLGYRPKPEPESRRPATSGAQTAGSAPVAASATATSDFLDVTFSDSSEVDPPLAAEPRRSPPVPPAEEARSRRPAAPAPAPIRELEPSLLDSDEEERPRSKTATTTTRRPGAPEKTPESKPADQGRSNTKSRVSDPFEDSLAGLDPVPVQAPKRGADPFSSQSLKRGADASSARSSTASDPFDDSRLMDDLADDLANDLGAGGGPDPLDDSGSDILDELPPHRRKDSPAPAKQDGDARFESDLDLLDEGSPELGDSDDDLPRPAPAATPRRGAPAVSSQSRAPAISSSSRNFDDSDDPDDDGGLSLLDSGEAPPPPPPVARKKEKEREKGGRAGKGPDLDEVLNMFGPEDGAPLDDGSGLEPAPLDLSPPGRAAAKPARAGGGGGGGGGGRDRDRGFDAELSDILEPLDPGEALEIIKTSNPKPGRRPSAAGGMNGRHEEPSGLEQLDDGEASAVAADEPRHDKRAAAKKSRGVPFPASDEDVGLFEDSSRGSRAQKKKTDPFARARGRLAEEDEREKRSGVGRPGADRDRSGSERQGSDRAERERGSGADRSGAERAGSERATRTDSRPVKRGGAAGGGPPPSGDGEHGLVLSRIADADKKEQAAEIIAEVKGCNMDEARRLTDRTIIPVLKGVSREVAEFHLEKFKRVKIAGRVTTRQRG